MGLMAARPEKIPKESVEEGDHIYTDRNKKTYYHHGIYIGDDKVIHFSKVSSRRPPREKDKCNHYPGETTTDAIRGVRMCCLRCFVRNRSLYRMKYDGGIWALVRTTQSATKSEAAVQVVAHAKQMLTDDDFGEYNLLTNNCESFAYYCKTGVRDHISKQVLRAIFIALIAVGSGGALFTM